MPNTVICGDCLVELDALPGQSVDLVCTSPPYFNARPELGRYETYAAYLGFLEAAVRKIARVLVDGRVLVCNTSPVLVARASRSDESRRLAIPFDLHARILDAGFDFVDDITWVKPEGAGVGRGRRFANDRNPLAYKPTPVTEYLLVYRKRSGRLVDWFLRHHPDRALVEASKVRGEYERTNVWTIGPSRSREHPATFPVALAERVIRYYSFRHDVVLDPFAGIGTTATAALNLGRRFCLVEKERRYLDHFLAIERARCGGGPLEVRPPDLGPTE
jgi:DNA modification methylase